MHAFAHQRGLRAKTDRWDATTIARALPSFQARFGSVPDEQGSTYRQRVRWQQQLSAAVVRYTTELHALLVVLFPEFSQVFADASRPTALGVLKAYRGAQAMREADPVQLGQRLHQLCPGYSARQTAEELSELAKGSGSNALVVAARQSSLRLLCDQVEHTQGNRKHLHQESEHLLEDDPSAKGLLAVAECGVRTVAVLRAELGELDRFARMDQMLAYAGMDLQIKESGKWKGQVKRAKGGSGRLRRILSLAALRRIRLPTSPVGR